MKKFKKFCVILLSIFTALFSAACAAAPIQEEDAGWVFDSIARYNQDRVKQISRTVITETADGTYEKTQLLISDTNNEILYMDSMEKGPGSYHLRTRDYLMFKDGKGYDIYKYDMQEDFYKTEIQTDFINNAFDSMYITLSDKAEAKILGSDMVDGTEAFKVLVTDSDFHRIQDTENFGTLYAQAAVSDAYQKELQTAFNDYMNMTKKEYIFWFSKENTMPIKMEYDNTLETALTYYALAAANPNACFEKKVPSKEIVTACIKSGSGCDKVELPSDFQVL